MARYGLRFKTSVAKDLRDIRNADVRRILEQIETLRDDPRLVGSEELSAQERYRLRQGNYRIFYETLEVEVVVEVVKISH